jgi:histidinol dehydrogenase
VVEDVDGAIKLWEQRKQNDLRKLAALIRKIIQLVKDCGGNAVLKYNVEGDKLLVCKAERKEMLPGDLYSKWDDVHNLEGETDTHNDTIQGLKTAKTRR